MDTEKKELSPNQKRIIELKQEVYNANRNSKIAENHTREFARIAEEAIEGFRLVCEKNETALTALNRIAFPTEDNYGNAQFIAMKAIKEITGKGK